MTGPLTSDQIASFLENGYLICPDFLSESAHAHVLAMVEEIAAWPSTEDRWQHYHERTAHGAAITRTENFLPFHEGMQLLLTEGDLTLAIGQLFGEAALVFKEKINYKLPGGAGFAPHQDARAYAYGTSHITCLVAVDENRIDNGCLWFAPQRHQQGLLENDDTGCLPSAVAESLDWVAAPMPVGGVSFFSSFAPHKSAANTTQQSRRSLYVTYTRASEGDLRQKYYHDRVQAMAQHQGPAGQSPRISTIGHFQGKGVE